MLTKRTRLAAGAGLAATAATIGVLVLTRAPGDWCTATNADTWRAAVSRHPLPAVAPSAQQVLVPDLGEGVPLVLDHGALQVWPQGRPHRVLLALPRSQEAIALDFGSGWVVVGITQKTYVPGPNGGKALVVPEKIQRIVGIRVADGRQVGLDRLRPANVLGAPGLVAGSVWWSTLTAKGRAAHRYDLATGRTTVASEVPGTSQQLSFLPTGVAWRTPGEPNKGYDYLLRTPLPPLVSAAFGSRDPNWLSTDGTSYAWWAPPHVIRWWQPGMTAVGSVTVPHEPTWVPDGVVGPFVRVSRASESSAEGVLDGRTGAVFFLDKSDPFYRDPALHALFPAGNHTRGYNPLAKYEVVPSDLPELRC